jgi:hypothetical protein
MNSNHLRLFREHPSGDRPPIAAKHDESTVGGAMVRTSLKKIFPLLVHAHRFNHSWLTDLGDDQIVITQDLADVLSSFEHLLNDRRA